MPPYGKDNYQRELSMISLCKFNVTRAQLPNFSVVKLLLTLLNNLNDTPFTANHLQSEQPKSLYLNNLRNCNKNRSQTTFRQYLKN